MSTPGEQGLYREAYEKDSCGFGLIANLDDAAQPLAGEDRHRLAEPPHAPWRHRRRRQDRRRLRPAAEEAREVPARGGQGRGASKLAPLFAAGNVFLSTDAALAARARDELAAQLEREGLRAGRLAAAAHRSVACAAPRR